MGRVTLTWSQKHFILLECRRRNVRGKLEGAKEVQGRRHHTRRFFVLLKMYTLLRNGTRLSNPGISWSFVLGIKHWMSSFAAGLYVCMKETYFKLRWSLWRRSSDYRTPLTSQRRLVHAKLSYDGLDSFTTSLCQCGRYWTCTANDDWQISTPAVLPWCRWSRARYWLREQPEGVDEYTDIHELA